MKRILAVILTLSLLLGAVPALSDVDYASDYETALTLALNDMTNRDNLETAVDILRRLGSYQLAKSYLQYTQALLELTSEEPDIRRARLRITSCAEAAAFVADLKERGFPSCDELMLYMDAREMELNGDLAGAYDAYKAMTILDAPDRSFNMLLQIDSVTPTVTVICRTEDGTVLSRETVGVERGGMQTVRAQAFEGYILTAESEEAVTVTADTLGRLSRREAVFVYRKLPDTLSITVVYRTDTGKVLARETADVERGGSMTVEARTFDGFDLVSGAAKKVQVFADNMGKLSQVEVVFTYRALPAYAEVTVVCQDEGGNQLRTEIVRIDRGSSKTIRAASLDGYELTGTSSAKVTVDSKGKADKSRVVFMYKKIRPKVAVGDYVTFGHYPQTAAGNDNTPIEWLVLDVQDGKALLISKYGLDAQPYNKEYTAITWEQCTLRSWLNGTFLDKAFTAQEQGAILLTNVDNSYSYWGNHGGNNTRDKIFLLSYPEANVYFGVTPGEYSDKQTRVAPTAYAIKKGAAFSTNNKTANGAAAGWWWLRSTGYDQLSVSGVGSDGFLANYYVSRDSGSVRPALWLNLDSGIF